MRVAAATDEKLEEIGKIPTPKDPAEAMARFSELAKSVSKGAAISAVAGSIRGRVVDGIFLYDKILEAWEGLPIVDTMSRSLGAPVSIVHDTAAIGVGEVFEGAGRGSKICAYVTVSTGVGGDRIIDGKVDITTYNPEMGRQKVNGIDLEDQISGTAIQKKFGIHPKDLESVDERNKLADILAEGLYNSALHWVPDTFVVGGSMIIGQNPIPLERTAAKLREMLVMYPTAPAVKKAELGDDGGLRGARYLAMDMVR